MSADRLRRIRPDAAGGLFLVYLVGVWLMIHWYQGITHDGVLYAGQALARLYPDLKRDLFFAYGSQDDFTLFTPLFAALAARTTIDDTAILLLSLAHIVWVIGALVLARRLIAGPALWLGLVLVFGTTGIYGPEKIFSYGEGFITARIWAEAFTLLAIACSVQRRRVPAVLLCFVALAIHPIIGLAGAGFIAFNSFTWRQVLAASAAAATLIALTVAVGKLPLAPLFTIMDAEWYGVIFKRAPYVLIDRWSVRDLNEVLCLLSVLALASLVSTGTSRRAWTAILLTAVIGLAVAWIAALTHHALLVQMQSWRVLWLVRLMAPLAAAWLLFEFWPKGPIHRLAIVWLVAGWLLRNYWGGAIAAATVGIFLWREHKGPVEVPRSIMLVSWLALALAALNMLVALSQEFLFAFYYYRASVDPARLSFYTLYLFTALFGAIVFPLALVPLWHLSGRSGGAQFLVLAAVAGFSLFAATGWDQRRPVDKDVYSGLARATDPLAEFFPPKATIYWENAFQFSWFAMHRPNYASGQQAVSALFSRDAAVEVKRRISRLARLNVPDGAMEWNNRPKGEIKPSFQGLVHVCHDRLLDFVVLSVDFGRGLARLFPRGDGWQRYVYDCAMLRAAFPDPFPR